MQDSKTQIREAQTYSCRYANTYSIIMVADGRQEAERGFIDWLAATHGVTDVERVSVRRLHLGERRPMYAVQTVETTSDAHFQIDWYDPTSGSWFDFDTVDDEESLASSIERLTTNARPYPCPRYRVSRIETYEVEAA